MSLVKIYNQIREATGLGRVFPRMEEPVFSAHNERFGTGKYVWKPIVDELASLIAKSHSDRTPGGRLTLTSGTPVTTSDVTGATTIYYTPHTHQTIELWDTTLKNWIAYPFAEIALALGTLTTLRPYDIFAYLNSGSITAASNATPISITSNSHGMSTGTMVMISGVEGNYAANGLRIITSTGANTFTIADLDGNSIVGNGAYTTGGTWYQVKIEALAWTSDTARATALVRQNGIYCKSGALDRRYLGSFYTTSTTTTEDSAKSRYVWNMYNRQNRALKAQDTSTSSYTANLNDTWREVRAGSTLGTSRVGVLVGLAESTIDLSVGHLVYATGGTASYFAAGIGIDSSSVNSAVVKHGYCNGTANTDAADSTGRYTGVVALGFHTYRWLELTTANATFTFETARTNMAGGIVGFVEA